MYCHIRFLRIHHHLTRDREDIRNNLLRDDILAVTLRSSGVVMFLHSLMLSVHILYCRPHLCPPSPVLCIMVFQRLLCRGTWPNHIFRHLIVTRKNSCRSTSLFDLASYIVIDFVFPVLDAEELSQAFFRKPGSFYLPQPGVSQPHIPRERWIRA